MSMLLDALICIAELLDLVDLVCGPLTSDGQPCTATPRREWWPPERVGDESCPKR
jgi:hypothetical protein